MSFTNWFPDVFRSSPPSKDGDETGKNNEDDVSKANDDGIITKDEDEIANENDDGILKGEDAILKSDNNIPKNDKDEISIRDEFDIPKDVDDLFDKQVDASLERELLEALDKEIAEDQTSTPLEEEGSKEQTPSSLRTDGKPVNFMVSSPSPKTSQPPILRERLSLNTTENAAPSPVSLLIDSEQPYVPPTYLPTGLPQAVWGEGPIPDFDRTKLDHFRDYMSANFSESPVINQHLFNELSAITDYGWNNINDLVSRGRTKTLELLIGRSDQLNLPRWHTALDLSVQNPVKRGHINILEDVTGSSKQFESRSPPLQGKEAVPLREQGPEISSAEDPSSPSSFVHPPEEKDEFPIKGYWARTSFITRDEFNSYQKVVEEHLQIERMHRLLVKMDAWEQDRQSRAQILQLQNRIDELQAALEKSQTEHGKIQTLLSESRILQPPMNGDIYSSNQSEKVEEMEPTPSLERRGSASSSTNITKSPIIRDIYESDADLYRDFQHMAMSVSLARAKIAGYCQNWMAMEVHAKNAAENSLPLDNPSMTAHCNYIQAIALYNQGNFVHAGELFEDSEACVGVYIEAEDFSGWLRRLDQLDLQSPAFSFSRHNAESFPNTSEFEPAPSDSSTNLRDMSGSQQSPGTHHTWQNLGDINLDSLDSASESFFPTAAEIDVMPYVDPRLRYSPSAPSDDCPSTGFESTKNHLKDDIGSLDEVYSTKSKARPGNAISFSIVGRTQDSSYLGSSGPSDQMLSSERASRLLDEHTKMGSAYNADPIRPQVGGLQPVRLGLAEHPEISGNDGLGIEHIPDGPPNLIQPTNIFSIESNSDPERQSPSAALDISTRSVKPLKCLSSESSENDPSMSLELMETLHLPRSPTILAQPANRFSIESDSDLERDGPQDRTRFAPFSMPLGSFDPGFRPPSPKFAFE